jgi:hypothetical protein
MVVVMVVVVRDGRASNLRLSPLANHLLGKLLGRAELLLGQLVGVDAVIVDNVVDPLAVDDDTAALLGRMHLDRFAAIVERPELGATLVLVLARGLA